jgi:competence ComEA-like helix-hairpin-helix protein
MNRRLSSPQSSVLLLILFCHAPVLVLNTSCVKLPRRASSYEATTTQTTRAPDQTSTLIDINRATREELMKLPSIGEGLAARIVEHRARYGAFRRAEHLLMVRGISERRFARLRPYVAVE